MAYSKVSYQNLAIKYGLLVGIAHILFFLIMRLLGLTDIVELSYLSGIFLVIGIVVAISKYKKLRAGMINYFEGLAIGAITAAVSSVILGIFLVLFIVLFDQQYLETLGASGLFPHSISILTMFLVTIVQGTWPGFLVAFIAMQWFKRPDHTLPNQA
ncbi:DUF4199 domain-containing protein [Pontibacter liquoris]|uniref:DUF4199 domain-containing protein n=1 Tax=Pontibacter liquoris TaxID=2905677 RepID=UPI001FA72A19|nr:DUF4199 domain-containing protein [Pontibacter liquoris]